MTYIPLIFKAVDTTGDPLVGGKLYTYQSDGVTLASTYTDPAGLYLASNPLILNAYGQVIVFAAPGPLHLNLTNFQDVQMPYYPAVITIPNTVGEAGLTGVGLSAINSEQDYVATEGQTIFTLTSSTYVPGTGNITVYKNGSRLLPTTDFEETNTSSIRLIVPAHAGDSIALIVSNSTTAATVNQLLYDLSDLTKGSKGAGLVAYSPFLTYPANTVGSQLSAAGNLISVSQATADAANAVAVQAYSDAPKVVNGLPALPSEAFPANKLVYDTISKKLYRSTGTAWESLTVDPANISGIIQDSQIAALAASKLSGTLVSSQLGNSIIDQTKMATGLRVPVVVNSLPALPSSGYPQGSMVTLTTDNKIYRSTGTVWTAAVPTSDLTGTISDAQIVGLAASKVTGQLSDAQLASISAAKLTGQITNTQITDNSISTSKIAAGAVTASQIAADTITAANIAAGAITSSELAAGSVVAGKIAAGSVTASDIAANTITSANIAADTITAGNIAAGAIGASEIAAGAVIAGKIAAGTIQAGDIAASAITGDKIAANTLTAGNIAAGAITSDQLASNSIIAGKISAGAIGASAIATGTLQTIFATVAKGIASTNYSPGTSSVAPTGFALSATPFTTTLIGGQTDTNCFLEIQGSANLAGYRVGGLTARAMSAIGDNGQSGSAFRCWYRGNNDPGTKGGAPDIGTLTVTRKRADNTLKNWRLDLKLQPTSYTSNLDGLRTAKIQWYKQDKLPASSGPIVCTVTVGTNAFYDRVSGGTGSFLTDGFSPGGTVTIAGFAEANNNGTFLISNVTATRITINIVNQWQSQSNASGVTFVGNPVLNAIDTTYEELPDRLFGNVTDSNAANAVYKTAQITDTSVANYPACIVTIYNASGPSDSHCFYSNTGAADGQNLVDNGTSFPATFTANGATGGSGGGSGDGGLCPAPDVPLLMADGTYKLAGDIQVNDIVIAWDEVANKFVKEYVTHAEMNENNRWWISLSNGQSGRFAHNHRFLTSNGVWKELETLIPGEVLFGGITVNSVREETLGPVVRITINRVHTYVTLGVVSHNLKPLV
jgi:hypothetical protein